MRKLTVVLALSALVAGTAPAQQSWNSEIGIQGGFARIKPAGTGQNDYIDVFGAPGPGYVLGLLSAGNVYAVIPWGQKMALEPSFNVGQLTSVGSATTARLGLRADYALSPKIYAAGGLVMLYLESSGSHVTTFGVQAGLGYRFPLVGPLNGRVEALVASVKKHDNLAPTNVYGVQLGVSSRLGGAAAAARRPAGRSSAWQKVFGVNGGYFRSHQVGGGQDLTGFVFPNLGGSLTALGTAVASPTALFVIFPLGEKTALEPGLDITRVQSNGTTTFVGNLSGRINYAWKGNWYGAAGGSLAYLKSTGVDAGTVLGANVGWGYRFGLGRGWGGRTELNYALYGKNQDLGVAPQNTTSLLFSVMMPLR